MDYIKEVTNEYKRELTKVLAMTRNQMIHYAKVRQIPIKPTTEIQIRNELINILAEQTKRRIKNIPPTIVQPAPQAWEDLARYFEKPKKQISRIFDNNNPLNIGTIIEFSDSIPYKTVYLVFKLKLGDRIMETVTKVFNNGSYEDIETHVIGVLTSSRYRQDGSDWEDSDGVDYDSMELIAVSADDDPFEKNVKTNTTKHQINNCLLRLIYDEVINATANKTFSERTKKKYNQMINHIKDYDNDVKISRDGMDEYDFRTISEITKTKIIARDLTGTIWREFVPNTKDKVKTFEILIHSNHAMKYDDLFKFSDQHPLTVTEIEKYLSNEDCPVIQICRDSDNNIQAYRTKTRQVRKLFPIHHDGNTPREALDDYYKKYDKLYPPPTKPIVIPQFESTHELCKLADHHMPSMSYNKPNVRVYGADRNGSYASYTHCDYYHKYQFPYPPNVLTNRKRYFDLNKSGFSIIDNVNLLHPLLVKQQRLQNKCIYANPLLKFMLDYHLATFDVIAVLYSNYEELACYDPLPTPTYETRHELREQYGKLIPHDNVREFQIMTKTDDEFEHMKHILHNHPKYRMKRFDSETKQIDIIQELPPTKKQNHYIHSYILAYHEIEILKVATKIDINDLVAIRVDAIYSNKPIPLDKSDYIPTQLGKWKPCELKNPPLFYNDLNLSQSPIYDSYQTQMQKKVTHNFRSYVGGPGAGKSFPFEKYPPFDLLVIAQSRKLVAKWANYFKANNIKAKATTSAKFTNTHTNKKYYYHAANILYDDVGVESMQMFEKVIKKATADKSNVFLTSDYFQLKPFASEEVEEDDEEDEEGEENNDEVETAEPTPAGYFSESEYYKLFTEVEVKYRPGKHRFTEEQLNRVQTIRQMLKTYPKFEYDPNVDQPVHVQKMYHYKPLTLDILALYKDRETSDPTTIPDDRIVLSPTHKRIEDLSTVFADPAHTFHSTQGQTIRNSLVIDAVNPMVLSFDPSLLYTGLSRAHSEKDIYILRKNTD